MIKCKNNFPGEIDKVHFNIGDGRVTLIYKANFSGIVNKINNDLEKLISLINVLENHSFKRIFEINEVKVKDVNRIWFLKPKIELFEYLYRIEISKNVKNETIVDVRLRVDFCLGNDVVILNFVVSPRSRRVLFEIVTTKAYAMNESDKIENNELKTELNKLAENLINFVNIAIKYLDDSEVTEVINR